MRRWCVDIERVVVVVVIVFSSASFRYENSFF